MQTTDAQALLKDFRRVQVSLRIGRNRKKRKFQSESDFIRKKHSYTCVYCHRNFANKPNLLHTTLAPHHTLKRRETIEDVMNHYQINEQQLLNLNPEFNDLEEFIPGTLFRVPPYFRIYFNKHGVCYCLKCKADKENLKLDYVSYFYHLYERRRNIRAQVTPGLKRRVFERDNYQCVYCDIEFGSTRPGTFLTLDHKKPVVCGGLSTEKNLCTSCAFHNFDKGSKTYDQYIQYIQKRRSNREKSLAVHYKKTNSYKNKGDKKDE